jgi:hypothetical protein
MIDKQTQALKRLTKKLSALRATLRKDERDLLDQLILGASADVAGHALTSAISTEAVTSRPTEVAAHAMTSAKSSKPASRRAEVAGHTLTSAISTEAVTSRPTEVAAHAMTSATSSIREAIAFDSAKAMYKVKARAA